MTNPTPTILIDITVPKEELEAARQFYLETFGYTAELDSPAPPDDEPMPFVSTDDLDATLAEIELKGGKVVSTTRQAGPVLMAMCEDPWGNELLVEQYTGWSPAV